MVYSRKRYWAITSSHKKLIHSEFTKKRKLIVYSRKKIVNSWWIRGQGNKSIVISISASRSYYVLTMFFREFALNSHFPEYTISLANPLSISRIQKEFSWCFVGLLWNPLVLCEYTSNSISISRIHYEFTIFVANQQRIHAFFGWIHFLSREFPINLLSSSRIL